MQSANPLPCRCQMEYKIYDHTTSKRCVTFTELQKTLKNTLDPATLNSDTMQVCSDYNILLPLLLNMTTSCVDFVHVVPSLHPLHLHLISKDFKSPCLKVCYSRDSLCKCICTHSLSCISQNKKHWNSFTTEFFVDARLVLERLQKHGK